MSKNKVDEYISNQDGWKGDIIAQLRTLVTNAAPEAKESFKWAQPVYELNGPFCYMKAFKNSVNFGFWRGVELDDPHGLLQGSGAKMRHVKLQSTDDIDEEAFSTFVKLAVNLNMEKGDPTKG